MNYATYMGCWLHQHCTIFVVCELASTIIIITHQCNQNPACMLTIIILMASLTELHADSLTLKEAGVW